MSLASRLRRLERIVARRPPTVSDRNLWLDLMLAQGSLMPGMELVEPQDTDPETFADIQWALAGSKGDWDVADYWEEQGRIARSGSEPQSIDELKSGLAEMAFRRCAAEREACARA